MLNHARNRAVEFLSQPELELMSADVCGLIAQGHFQGPVPEADQLCWNYWNFFRLCHVGLLHVGVI